VPNKKSPLPYAQRSDLFSQLAALEKAGLSAQMAFSTVKLPATNQSRLNAMRALLARGRDIPSAGFQTGVFSEIETHLLRAATSAGSPAQTYRRLADTYALKVRLSKKIRSRMMLPITVFLIALVVQPLPGLVSGALSAGGYVWHVLRPLLAIGLGYRLVRWLPEWLADAPPSCMRTQTEACLIQLPVVGALHVRSNVRDFFESLALMLEAGLPMFDALPKACKTIHNQKIRTAFSRLLSNMKQGATLGMALETVPYLGDRRIIEFVKTGEASGTLPEMMFRHIQFETDAIAHFQEQVAEWLPRLIYGAVALWMAYGILTGGGFQPNLPAELR
jgi:general secretion pathway protein F